MKKHDSDIEFYRETISILQEEKASCAAERDALRLEINEMAESHRQEMEGLRQTLEAMRLTLLDQTRTIAELTSQLTNARAAEKMNRGKRFSPTTEQRDLLNNRRTDTRAEEKDGFDGNPPAGAGGSCSGKPEKRPPAKKSKKRSEGRKAPKEDYGCDETIVHKLGSYFDLPDGAVLKTRDGNVEIHAYESYEYIPGRIVRHLWETATYVDSIGDAHNTLPVEARENPVAGCPFSPEMLAFILTEKYAYHTPKNRIKRKLREMGARFSKTSFVRYYQLSEKALREMLAPVFSRAITDCSYLMIDETCELVGVIDPVTHIAGYMRKYLWAFHDKQSGLVWYLYEKGSRAREVVAKVLAGFRGAFTSDGYAVYKAFGNMEEYPDLMHCGCWVHVRRNFIEAMGVASEICWKFIEEIDLLFENERLFKDMDDRQRASCRQKASLPVLNRIYAMAKRVAEDAGLMGRSLLRKAVNYVNNQTEILRNFIQDGKVEISNNLCEQRMKPIKLDLKNCQNIGSEGAAQNAAFMHSLVESCRLNDKNPYDYLLALFRKMRSGLDDIGMRLLLPDRWMSEC